MPGHDGKEKLDRELLKGASLAMRVVGFLQQGLVVVFARGVGIEASAPRAKTCLISMRRPRASPKNLRADTLTLRKFRA
jgi:hypothetical protein